MTTDLVDGDTVTRKAGGPMMTVEGMREDGLVRVLWIDAGNTVHRDVIARAALQKWRAVD